MKRIVCFLIMALGLVSCSKETTKGKPMNFEISVVQTRADKTDWVTGDKVYVFFKGMENKHLVLTRASDGSWTDSFGAGKILDTDFVGLNDQAITAIHFPENVDVDYADNQFSFTKDGEPVYNYYLSDVGTPYTVKDNTVTANLVMGKPADFIQIHVDGIDNKVSDYTLGCPLIAPAACGGVDKNGRIIEEALQAGVRLKGTGDADGAIFAGKLVSNQETDCYFTLSDNDRIYTMTYNREALTQGTINLPAPTETGGTSWVVTNASDLYVDLGLTSGLKWSKYNIGASSETDYGDFFAWGEIQPKGVYTWSSYQFNPKGDGKTFSKYSNVSEASLLPEDDAAFSALGGKFRMATYNEWSELEAECDWKWTDDYNGTGVSGRIVTGKKTGYTDRSIFLPAGGYMDGNSLSNLSGFYWSSSLETSFTSLAKSMNFGNTAVQWYMNNRYRGCLIRPVSK